MAGRPDMVQELFGGPGETDAEELVGIDVARQTPSARDGRGEVSELARGADIIVGLSVPEAFSVDDVRAMSDDAIVLALANPDPKVRPDEAREAGAAVVGTGRSDFPQQVNNALAADLIEEPDADSILPAVLDEQVVPAVAGAVAGER
jgi:malate dehydrogenase (oxaloacetate-decarboxylating)